MVTLEEDPQVFGIFTDKIKELETPIRKFIFKNANKLQVEIITYGATITSIKFPNKSGLIEDLVCGYDTLEGYLSPENPYFGATIGRMANRIGHGRIIYKDQIIEVNKNAGEHQLHGGFIGFDKVVWDALIKGTKLVMSYYSADMEEGYPGHLVVHVTYELSENNEILIGYEASTTKPTFVNLTNHSYFNLAGHNRGAEEIYKHTVYINADNYTETNDESIPTGNILPVCQTIFDLQCPTLIGDVIDKVPIPEPVGFDHNFCINKLKGQTMIYAARVVHADSGRILEVSTDQPGVQFYTANNLPENVDEKPVEPDMPKGDYYKHGAFCLECQNFPDAPNHTNFPCSVLLPGCKYQRNIIFKFSVKEEKSCKCK